MKQQSNQVWKFVIDREVEAPARFQAIQTYRATMAILRQQVPDLTLCSIIHHFPIPAVAYTCHTSMNFLYRQIMVLCVLVYQTGWNCVRANNYVTVCAICQGGIHFIIPSNVLIAMPRAWLTLRQGKTTALSAPDPSCFSVFG